MQQHLRFLNIPIFLLVMFTLSHGFKSSIMCDWIQNLRHFNALVKVCYTTFRLTYNIFLRITCLLSVWNLRETRWSMLNYINPPLSQYGYTIFNFRVQQTIPLSSKIIYWWQILLFTRICKEKWQIRTYWRNIQISYPVNQIQRGWLKKHL